jgi:hypothetical protein
MPAAGGTETPVTGDADAPGASGSTGTLLCPYGMPDAGTPWQPSTSVTYDRSCASDADCMIGTHYLDCCGTVIALGINKSEVNVFVNDTGVCHQPPTCRCLGHGVVAEDGRTSTDTAHMSDVAVSCSGGACATHIGP